MPRPLIRKQQNVQSNNNILSMTCESKPEIDKLRIDQLLRQPRSKKYMDAIHNLDDGGHVHNEEKIKAIIKEINNEYPEIEISSILIGYVAVCYLGKLYEVHTLSISDEIIEHYKRDQILPNGLEKVRSLAIRGGYDFIEVYSDCYRAISSNGSVSVIKI